MNPDLENVIWLRIIKSFYTGPGAFRANATDTRAVKLVCLGLNWTDHLIGRYIYECNYRDTGEYH